MSRIEMTLSPEDAEAFDRFFWAFVAEVADVDGQISLTAFSGAVDERRIVTLEGGEAETAFQSAWNALRCAFGVAPAA